MHTPHTQFRTAATTRWTIVLLLLVGGVARGQVNPPPTSAAADAPAVPAQTEMQKWIATTDAQWQAAFNHDVTDVHAAEIKKIAQQYATALEAAITKASGAGDLDGSLALRTEQKRYADTNVFPEQDDAADAPVVKQIRATIRAQLARIEKDNAVRAKALLAKYDQMLASAQTQLTQHKRLDDAVLVKNKRDEVAAAWATPAITPGISPAIAPVAEKPAPVTTPAAGQNTAGPSSLAVASFYDRIGKALRSPKKTTPVGNAKNGNSFTAVPPEAALLVGIAVKKGDWFGNPIISALQPIFETRTGRIRGATVGKKVEQFPLVVEAKPGYVVSELLVCAPQNHIHGIKVIFRKLDIFHQGVVASDLYESDWIGIDYEDKSKRVGDPTRPAIGLIGRADEWVGAVGLLHLP